jgi:hypothetical protein
MKTRFGFIAALIATLLFATAARATNKPTPPKPEPTYVAAVSEANATASGVSTSFSEGGDAVSVAKGGNAVASGGKGGSATAKGGAGGKASASQDQSQTASADNAGNSQSITHNQVRQAPMAYAPDAYPSAPCRVSGSAGASGAIGGISLGGSKMDAECDRRETARSFALLGQYEAALKILCMTKAAQEALGADCVNYAAPGPAPTSPTVLINSTPGISAADLKERDRRLVETFSSK